MVSKKSFPFTFLNNSVRIHRFCSEEGRKPDTFAAQHPKVVRQQSVGEVGTFIFFPVSKSFFGCCVPNAIKIG